MRMWMLCLLGSWMLGMPSAYAARVLVYKADGRPVEYQSHARPGTLLENATQAGIDLALVEERDISPEDYALLHKQFFPPPAPAEEPVDIPLSDFGDGLTGAALALAGQGVILKLRKKKERV